jgi:hypothetical protein
VRWLRSVSPPDAQRILAARQRADGGACCAPRRTWRAKTDELARSLAMMRATLEATTDGIS